MKRFNSHEKIPRRSQGSHDIFLPASGEDPRGYMRLDPEYQEAAPDVSDPKNEGNQWNEEAGGVENAIGEGAHANGALDAMIEPATPRQDVNSYDGGAEGDNVKAMVQSAAEESEEDESAGPFEDWKPAEKSKWEYDKEKDTPEMHDIKMLLERGCKKQKLRAHSDLLPNRAVNDWALSFGEHFDIQTEAKGKNIAAEQLYRQYQENTIL